MDENYSVTNQTAGMGNLPKLRRRLSTISTFTIRSTYGDKPPGDYVLVYEPLDKKLFLDTEANVKSGSTTDLSG